MDVSLKSSYLLLINVVQLAGGSSESFSLQQVLEEESRQKKKLEEEVRVLRSQVAHLSVEANQVCSIYITCVLRV